MTNLSVLTSLLRGETNLMISHDLVLLTRIMSRPIFRLYLVLIAGKPAN